MKGLLDRGVLFLKDLYTYRYFHRIDKAPRYRGVYPTLAAALAMMPKGEPTGFDIKEVPEFFFNRQFAFNRNDYAVIFWLSTILAPNARVFDLGGGFGQCFYTYQQFLRFPEGLQWMACDVESFREQSREYAASQNITNLSFTSDRKDADGCDVYLTNGAIHYIEPELPEILKELKTLPPHVLVNRVPMYEGETFFTTQSSKHSYVAHRVASISAFVKAMEATGYETVDRWELPRSLSIPFHPERYVSNYRGFYFRRKP